MKQDPLTDFLDETCITGPDFRCIRAQLWEKYGEWRLRHNVKGLGSKAFTQAMAKRAEVKHGNSGTFYVGIGIRQ